MSVGFTKSQKCFSVELLCLFHRWQEEGDLPPHDALEAVQFALNEWLSEEVVIFEPDECILECLNDDEPDRDDE